MLSEKELDQLLIEARTKTTLKKEAAIGDSLLNGEQLASALTAAGIKDMVQFSKLKRVKQRVDSQSQTEIFETNVAIPSAFSFVFKTFVYIVTVSYMIKDGAYLVSVEADWSFVKGGRNGYSGPSAYSTDGGETWTKR